MSALHIPCWVYDVETRTFLEVNAAAERIYGYSRSEFLGMNLADIRRPAEAARLTSLLDQRARGEPVAWPTHWIHRTRHGNELAVTLEAVDVCWYGRAARMVLVTDVTQRRRAEIEVKLLYECLESAGDIVVVTAAELDSRGDRPILYVNRAFEERTGYTRAEVIGRDARLLQGPASEPATVRRMSEALTRWKPVRVEIVNYTRAGEPYWIDMTITPVADDRGWYHYWFAIERDVSDRKRSEHQMADANIELERRVAQRTRELQHTVDDLENFNRMVSHDLQNPLNGVLGLSDLFQARHGASLPAEASRLLYLIRHSADQMHLTIADLLSLSRISSMQARPVPVDLSELCMPIVTALRGRQPEREVRFQVLQAAELRADFQLLQVAFQQLLDNAWKYTAKVAGAVIAVSARDCAEGAVITVQDNGPGFDAATAQALFSPFKRLRGAAGFDGTGIGLAIVARALDRLGGWVWAEGWVGQGARFHVFLPNGAQAADVSPALPGALRDER
jgi:PAS domain S-box-containing protein